MRKDDEEVKEEKEGEIQESGGDREGEEEEEEEKEKQGSSSRKRRRGGGRGEENGEGFFNTRSPKVPTFSSGPVCRPGSIFDRPAVLRVPPETENWEKLASRFFPKSEI